MLTTVPINSFYKANNCHIVFWEWQNRHEWFSFAGVHTDLSCAREGILGAVPTTGNGEQVGMPGNDVEHASDGDAGQSAVEAAEAEVDGVKRCGDAEC